MNYQFSDRMSQLKVSPLRENAHKNMEQKEVISFAYGYPPVDAFPMETMGEIAATMFSEFDPESFLQYGATEGYPELRRLLKKRLQLVTNIPQAGQEEVVIVSGSSQAMDLAVRVLCNEGDIVLCEEQTFSGAVNAIKGYGAIPMALPMDLEKQTIDLTVLEAMLKRDQQKRIKLLYLIPTFQNPLGTSIPFEERKKIYALAKKYQVIIFEDDPYGDLLYQGEAIPKIKTLDTEGLVIYAGSFSKILAPSCRLGFILASDPILEKLILAKQVSDSHSNFFWQVLVAEFMKHYQFEAHVASLKGLYKEKFNLMMTCLQAFKEEELSFIEPTGGYFICCKLGEEVEEERFFDYLEKQKVAIIPGNVMSVAGKGYEKSFRLNFTKPTLKEIKQGMRIIAEGLQIATYSKAM
ncbi:aminotransferase [Enterococcus florum]|uniref:Aminotransferase n=1 Tax=Enterococcus florum TaxID=2480627 RepID=A0A4P5PL95_9ENTE|nr:PLP-dependent aminotransferase family protein [Enterococcus florum]GCF94063.1 aminotransferase [Enterococcus florum]